MEDKYHVILNVSLAHATLSKAQTVLSVAQTHPEIANTFSACAVLLLAAALEQGIKSRLDFVAKSTAFEENIQPSATKAGMLSEKSIRVKMVGLPRLLSDDRFELIPNNPDVKNLHKLISLRNSLLHINEPSEHLMTPDHRIIVDDEAKKMYVIVPKPTNEWDMVSLKDVEEFQSAVSAYFSEVLTPGSRKVKSGLIIRETRW